MRLPPVKIVVFGLSITSSWGNGHATTYRSLVRELSKRGHDVLFLERETPWYGANRDLPVPPYGRTALYYGLMDLKERFSMEIEEAHFVIIGSYVPEGASLGEWVLSVAKGATAFYDIDTPVTMAMLERGDEWYLTRKLIPRYDMYLSFTGGPILEFIERRYGSPMARPLYCSVDPELYFPKEGEKKFELGYLGTYSPDRQKSLDNLLLEPARRMQEERFVVAGPLYPKNTEWPKNVKRIEHLPPQRHREFYNSMKFTLNITRADMIKAGYSPSVRLFEAASCGTPIISDYWEGLDSFFRPEAEIIVSRSPEETTGYLRGFSAEDRRKMGLRARARILAAHTSVQRIDELEGYMKEVLQRVKV